MGDFKKSYSKLEREKMEQGKESRDENMITLVSNRRESNEGSSFMSGRKHYSKLQLEKMSAKENQIQEGSLQKEKVSTNITPRAHVQAILPDTEKILKTAPTDLSLEVDNRIVEQVQIQEGGVQNMGLPVVTQATRTPLQMIQSEAERETMMIQDSSQKNNPSTHLSQRKRTYDGISSIETYQYSTEKLNTLKKMKKSDENQMESLDEMLSKSKKKMPKIQMEKILNQEKERLEKEKLLKEMSVTLKDAIFKIEDPIGFSNGYRQGLNSRLSFGDNKNRDSLSGKSTSINTSSRSSLSLPTNNTCILCGNDSEAETLIRRFSCLHKAHMVRHY